MEHLVYKLAMWNEQKNELLGSTGLICKGERVSNAVFKIKLSNGFKNIGQSLGKAVLGSADHKQNRS